MIVLTLKNMNLRYFLFQVSFLWLLCLGTQPVMSQTESLLAPVKTDSPRDTMRSFMTAMNQYRKFRLDKDYAKAEHYLERATRTLDTSGLPELRRLEKAKQSAILLKEVIDRVIVIDYDKIPVPDPGNIIERWRLKDTEITIVYMKDGDRRGEYLFSKNTVLHAEDYYNVVKDLPYLAGSGQGALYERPFQERIIPSFLRSRFLNLESWQWIGLFLAIILGYFVKVLVRIILRISQWLLRKASKNLGQDLIKITESPASLLAASGFWYIAVRSLGFTGLTQDVLIVITQSIFSVALIWVFVKLTDFFGDYLVALAKLSEIPLDDNIYPILQKTLKFTVLIIGVLLAIQNLGINVMSLLAGLGLGGLAFALAAKDTAANLIGSIMILIDRPFGIGDYIIVNEVEGTVEEIGLRSTRIRSLHNSQISIPNSKLAVENIDNMGRRTARRVKTYLGVVYGTPVEKLTQFVEGIKQILDQNPYTIKDNYHVVFNEYADSSLNILVYFHLNVADWRAELLEREKIFKEIFSLAQDLGVEFAFPSRSLYIEQVNGLSTTAQLKDD